MNVSIEEFFECTLSYGKEIRDTTPNARTKKFCDATMNVITAVFLCVPPFMESVYVTKSIKLFKISEIW